MTAARCPDVRWIALLSGLVVLSAAPRAARACFFYEGAEDVPVVDQTAMEVVLRQLPATEDHPDGQTRMVMGVRTEGDVPELGWIVPVPRYPHPSIEDDSFSLVSLDDATAPTFRTASGYGGSASAASGSAGCGGAEAESVAADPRQDHEQVIVWDVTYAGPYEVTVLTADSLDLLRTWVVDNSFQWLPSTEPDFQHYIDERWFFVAAKIRDLHPPSLTPLSLVWDGSELVVPLMLSRRDASADMGLIVWIIADSPAVPRNWAQVSVPQEQIEVDDYESNYADLVEQAVEVAGGGQAFVTEYVQPAETTALEINDEPTRALVGTDGWVTRLYTRVDPEDVTVDPVFDLDESIAPIAQLHDLTQVEGGPYWGAAIRPLSGVAPVALFVLGRLARRRRRG